MVDAQTIATYGQNVQKYEDMEASVAENKALSRFLGLLAPKARIFDLGCGPGTHAAKMLEAGFNVSALDATPEFVKAARAKGVDARLGVFEDLTEVDAYDAIWASFSLLHAPKADLPHHLSAIHQALHANGLLYLGLKLGEGEHREHLGRLYSYFSQSELTKALADTGFDIMESHIGQGKGLAGDISEFILITARRA